MLTIIQLIRPALLKEKIVSLYFVLKLRKKGLKWNFFLLNKLNERSDASLKQEVM